MTDPTAPPISVATPTGSLPAAPPQRPVTPPPSSSRPVAVILKDIERSISNMDRMQPETAAAQLRSLWAELGRAAGDGDRFAKAIANANEDLVTLYAESQRTNFALRNEVASLRAALEHNMSGDDGDDDDGDDDDGDDDDGMND